MKSISLQSLINQETNEEEKEREFEPKVVLAFTVFGKEKDGWKLLLRVLKVLKTNGFKVKMFTLNNDKDENYELFDDKSDRHVLEDGE